MYKIGDSITFVWQFAASKLGKTGLDVTVKALYRNGLEIIAVADAACTEIGSGLYSFELDGGYVNANGHYDAVASTDDNTVDLKEPFMRIDVGDLLENVVPGDYASGSAGHALGRIGSGQITTVSPVAQNGNVVTDQGDGYLAVDGRAIDWTESDNSTWPPDLTNATITVIISKQLQLAGSVVTPTGSSKKVRCEPTSEQTLVIEATSHAFQVIASFDTAEPATLIRGKWTNNKLLTAPVPEA